MEELKRISKEKERINNEMLIADQLSLAETLQREKDLLKLNQDKTNTNKAEIELLNKLRMNEKFLKFEITRLKGEYDKNNKMWEKKFEILKRR
jgi:hypothetical protein